MNFGKCAASGFEQLHRNDWYTYCTCATYESMANFKPSLECYIYNTKQDTLIF